jgi:hypothetical protein
MCVCIHTHIHTHQTTNESAIKYKNSWECVVASGTYSQKYSPTHIRVRTLIRTVIKYKHSWECAVASGTYSQNYPQWCLYVVHILGHCLYIVPVLGHCLFRHIFSRVSSIVPL